MSNDFWEHLTRATYAREPKHDFVGLHLASEQRDSDEADRILAAVGTRMAGKSLGAPFESVRPLTDVERSKLALDTSVEAGAKVAFVTSAESVFTYSDRPQPDMTGVVVSVRTASGDVTVHGGRVFVRWSDGVIRGIYPEHLRLASSGTVRKAQAVNRIRVASLGDISGFLRIGTDQLIHKATQDLWSLKQDSSGYVIERLFDDSGSPVKV